MVEAGPKYKSFEDLPAGLSTAALRFILSVADTKHRMGLQFSHWVTGTPALEAAVGSAAITQDELGHARSLYGLLRHHPEVPEGVGAENDLEARDIYYCPQVLLAPWEQWSRVVAVMTLLDCALEQAVAQTADSAFLPLAGRTAKILQEERFHRIFAHSWLERLGNLSEAAKKELQAELNWAWGVADGWLGPNNDAITTALAEAGILQGGSGEMRAAWLAAVKPVLQANGFEVPAGRVNWDQWDATFRQ